LLGLAAYALARAGFDAFYTTLAVPPQEVGVTYSDILSRAAMYLALFALVTPFYVEQAVLAASAKDRRRDDRKVRRFPIVSGTVAPLVAFLVLVVLLGNQLLLLSYDGYAGLVIWLLALGATEVSFRSPGVRTIHLGALFVTQMLLVLAD